MAVLKSDCSKALCGADAATLKAPLYRYAAPTPATMTRVKPYPAHEFQLPHSQSIPLFHRSRMNSANASVPYTAANMRTNRIDTERKNSRSNPLGQTGESTTPERSTIEKARTFLKNLIMPQPSVLGVAPQTIRLSFVPNCLTLAQREPGNFLKCPSGG
jgi:hypothetical protein